MCDPVTLMLGMAAKAGGTYLQGYGATQEAEREAQARNGVLSTAINGLNQDYNNVNAPAFAGAVGGIPTNASLKDAQDARTNTIMGNVPAASAPAAPAGAPPALAASRASQMKNATDFIQNQGAATGKLGGYGDSWFNSGLNEQDAARKIGVGNLFANETKSLISPEQDLAGAAAYKPQWTSMLGSILGGSGDMLGSNAGSSKPIGKGLSSIFGNLGGGSNFSPGTSAGAIY